jgi:hypothetical protein
VYEEIIDMSGYMFDFRGKNPDVTDTVNTFHQILIVKLDSSGRKVKVTLNDSVRIYYSVSELIPEYAIGYLGKTLNPTGLSTTPFQLFKGLDGDLSLQNFTASVLVQNYVGATGRLTVKRMALPLMWDHLHFSAMRIPKNALHWMQIIAISKVLSRLCLNSSITTWMWKPIQMAIPAITRILYLTIPG